METFLWLKTSLSYRFRRIWPKTIRLLKKATKASIFRSYLAIFHISGEKNKTSIFRKIKIPRWKGAIVSVTILCAPFFSAGSKIKSGEQIGSASGNRWNFLPNTCFHPSEGTWGKVKKHFLVWDGWVSASNYFSFTFLPLHLYCFLANKSSTGFSAASGIWALNYLANINLQDNSPCKIDQTHYYAAI